MTAADKEPPKHGVWATIWAAWLALLAISFAILEGIALWRKAPGDTLSENIRIWIGTKRGWKSAGVLGFIAGLLGFMIWFVPHIVWEVW